MKFKAFVISWGLMMAAVYPSLAKEAGDQGIGVLLGSPTGVTMKFWLNQQVALEGALGVAQGDLDTHVVFLFHDSELFKRMNLIQADSGVDMPVYIGAGPRIVFRDQSEFGLRLPLGVSLLPHETPWEFYAEVAPIVRMTPSTGANLDFGVGARYYFEAIRPRR